MTLPQQIIRVDLGIGAEMKIRVSPTMNDYIVASQQTAKSVLSDEEVEGEVKRYSAREILTELTKG